MHRVAHRAARFVRGSRHARGTVDNPTSSLSFYPQGSTYPGRFSVQTIGATSYGNTAIEKRYIFYRRLLPLLEYGREREGIDLSKVTLTHHNLKDQGQRMFPLGEGGTDKLAPLGEAGSGSVQEQEKARLDEIIAKVNNLFEGDLTEDDRLVYGNHVIKGKLLESKTLEQQAANNTKEQFANSPDQSSELMNAIMDALTAHGTMSKQALGSAQVRSGLRDILLGPAQLYEALRERADARATAI